MKDCFPTLYIPAPIELSVRIAVASSKSTSFPFTSNTFVVKMRRGLKLNRDSVAAMIVGVGMVAVVAEVVVTMMKRKVLRRRSHHHQQQRQRPTRSLKRQKYQPNRQRRQLNRRKLLALARVEVLPKRLLLRFRALHPIGQKRMPTRKVMTFNSVQNLRVKKKIVTLNLTQSQNPR